MRTKRLGRSHGERRLTAPRCVSMVDTCTHVEHFVTDESVASGRSAGRYVAACTAVVVPGSLEQSGHHFCEGCRDWAAQR